MAPNEQSIRERFQLTLDLFELSERMLRQKLRRTHPELSEAEIDSKVLAWLRHRPGAEHGDADGRLLELPRSGS
jgi:hypothetical protein